MESTKMTKKPSKLSKLAILGTGLIVAAGIGVGVTYALLTGADTTSRATGLADLRVDLDETTLMETTDLPLDSVADYKVGIQNTGEQAQFVRVMAVPDITATVEGLDAPLLLPSGYSGDKPQVVYRNLDTSKWVDGEDGYFYYIASAVQPNEKVTLFDGIQVVKENLPVDLADSYDKASMHLKVRTDAINIAGGKDASGNVVYNFDEAFFTGKTDATKTAGQRKVSEAYRKLARVAE